MSPVTLYPVSRGVLYGIGAYGLWGLFPLYFPLLDPAGPIEVLAHRIGWSLVFAALILAVRSRLGALRPILRDRRLLRLLMLAAALIAANWALYIYAVTSDRVIEAALGYFINPLISVAFGLLVFKERLRRTQWIALGLGSVAVLVLTTAAGGFPWIAVVLALLFGLYGLVKKVADVGAAEGLAIEALLLVLPAATYLGVLASGGDGTFTNHGTGHALLLVAAGPVTVIPLALFSACVTRVPLSTVGLLQYMAPVLQFLIGWLVAGEHLTTSRWIGFTLVWAALVVLTTDGLRTARRGAPEPQPMVA